MSVERIESALARLPDFISEATDYDLDTLDAALDEAIDAISRERNRRREAQEG